MCSLIVSPEEFYRERVLGEIARTITQKNQGPIYQVIDVARLEPDLYDRFLPVFKRAIAEDWGKRLDSLDVTKNDWSSYASFVFQLGKVKNGGELLEKTNEEWLKEALVQVVVKKKDVVYQSMGILRAIEDQPKLTGAFMEIYECFLPKAEENVRGFDHSGCKVITPRMREILGLGWAKACHG